MTPDQFKAWFEGFYESMDGPPGAKAWERIQARVKEITGNPITERVYIDRYRDWFFNDIHRPYRAYYSAGVAGQNGVGNAVLMNATSTAKAFDGHSAMNALGRTEAATLAA